MTDNRITWPTYLFVTSLLMLMLVSFALSSSGALLPRPDRSGSVSLRDVSARRTHFFHHYAFGK